MVIKLLLNLHYCSLGLGGPGCYAVGGRLTGGGAGDAMATQFLTEQQLHRLCPVLCENQVGSDTCACEFQTVDETASPDLFDVDQVCNGFCAASVNLLGCRCGRATVLRTVRETSSESGNGNMPEIETTTEPDWASLCATLCQVGEGGALCNCDRPPFV